MRAVAHRPLPSRGAELRLLALTLLAAPLVAQHRDFPHQPHLQVDMDCQYCHGEAAGSTAAEDNLLPNEAVCTACHSGQGAVEVDTTWIASLRPGARSYRFDHAFHMKLGNPAPLIAAAIDSGTYHGRPGDARRFLETANTCAACHRGLQESEAVEPGVHMPRMGDCIVCHTRIDNPFTCPDCHRDGAELKPADHTREFVDGHSTGKAGLDKLSCLPCHGRNFACMGCH